MNRKFPIISKHHFVTWRGNIFEKHNSGETRETFENHNTGETIFEVNHYIYTKIRDLTGYRFQELPQSHLICSLIRFVIS